MAGTGKRPERQRLRRFGVTVATGFLLFGSISWWRGHTVAPTVLWSAAALLVIPALVAPLALRPVERGWLTLGGWLAWVNTRIILTVVFYVVVSPLAVIMRFFRDPLDRQIHEAGRTSYWIMRPAAPFDAKSYERQF